MKRLYTCIFVLADLVCFCQDTSKARIPFEGYDLTWINGQNRQHSLPLSFENKNGELVLTGVAYLDCYFNYNFNRPKDNTHTVSSTIGRHNEFTLNLASIGIESGYRNIIGRLWLQFGQMASIIQETDGSTARGRNTSVSNLKYIREAAAGYHFNKWYGLNLEMGIFMSYIGLESYITQENWSYQRSMVCDFTPFYFSGARAQIFPTRNFKTELWLLNGWQTYNSWNNSIGIGSSSYYRPNEALQLVANFYMGKDSKESIGRFHHDNSIVYRYIDRPGRKGVSKAAFSINNHYGFQKGGTVNARNNYMAGTSVANRLWFCNNKLAVTIRGDYVANPGLYLAFQPSPVTPNDFTEAIDTDPGKKLSIVQATSTLDIMPNDEVTFRMEFGFRKSNIPYFAGREGTTSPDGWITTPAGNWRPGLKKDESRITVAVNFRL